MRYIAMNDASNRDALFISHASPEGSVFTLWLGARLSAAGYEIRADVLRLRSGHIPIVVRYINQYENLRFAR